jgi:hypothetical protein
LISGTPASVDAKLNFSYRSEEGALLLCDNLACERFVLGKTSFKDWGKTHARQLFIEEPQTRQFGFFIVTSVYRTKGCLLKCWSTTTRSVAPSTGVRTPVQFPHIEVTAEAKTMFSGGAWMKYPSADGAVFNCFTSANAKRNIGLTMNMLSSWKDITFALAGLGKLFF